MPFEDCNALLELSPPDEHMQRSLGRAVMSLGKCGLPRDRTAAVLHFGNQGDFEIRAERTIDEGRVSHSLRLQDSQAHIVIPGTHTPHEAFPYTLEHFRTRVRQYLQIVTPNTMRGKYLKSVEDVICEDADRAGIVANNLIEQVLGLGQPVARSTEYRLFHTFGDSSVFQSLASTIYVGNALYKQMNNKQRDPERHHVNLVEKFRLGNNSYEYSSVPGHGRDATLFVTSYSTEPASLQARLCNPGQADQNKHKQSELGGLSVYKTELFVQALKAVRAELRQDLDVAPGDVQH